MLLRKVAAPSTDLRGMLWRRLQRWLSKRDPACLGRVVEFAPPRLTLAGVNFARCLLPLLCSLVTAGTLAAQSDWDEPFPPHRIADHLYYVGSKGLASYLITTTKGHILINSSFERTVPIIRGNVEKLGFKFTDIKILLASHAHSDHVAGHALIKELTGARVEVMVGDAQVITSGGKGQYLYSCQRRRESGGKAAV